MDLNPFHDAVFTAFNHVLTGFSSNLPQMPSSQVLQIRFIFDCPKGDAHALKTNLITPRRHRLRDLESEEAQIETIWFQQRMMSKIT